MPRKLAAGNWKMNGDGASLAEEPRAQNTEKSASLAVITWPTTTGLL